MPSFCAIFFFFTHELIRYSENHKLIVRLLGIQSKVFNTVFMKEKKANKKKNKMKNKKKNMRAMAMELKELRLRCWKRLFAQREEKWIFQQRQVEIAFFFSVVKFLQVWRWIALAKRRKKVWCSRDELINKRLITFSWHVFSLKSENLSLHFEATCKENSGEYEKEDPSL